MGAVTIITCDAEGCGVSSRKDERAWHRLTAAANSDAAGNSACKVHDACSLLCLRWLEDTAIANGFRYITKEIAG